jgi:cyclophilin family peptidyl-prolyl cis-trans isomerase
MNDSNHKIGLARFMLVAVICCLIVSVLSVADSIASHPIDTSDSKEASTASRVDSLKAEYEKALADAKAQAKVCRRISTRFFDSSLARSYDLKKDWEVESKKLADCRDALQDSAIAYFMSFKGSDKPEEPLLQLAAAIGLTLAEEGNNELAYSILDRVDGFVPEAADDIKFQRDMALIGIKTNHFDRAVKFLENPQAAESIEELESKIDKALFYRMPMISAGWEREKELRQKELAEDDLPRVKLQFADGDVVIELFENEAPETVASFLSLVESAHFDKTVVHPVVEGLLAQFGGFRIGVGPISANYVTRDEARLPESRKHFTGSVAMVRGRIPGSTGSQFAITMMPVPHLDWDGTEDDNEAQIVFGRVVEGLDVISKIPATLEYNEEEEKEEPIKGVEPGVLERATVIRKRDHEYKFEKLN